MFIYNLKDIAKKLKIDFDGITQQIYHNGVKGTAREDLLKKYLIDLLPKKYSISSGIIIDSDQNQSKQQDFIIFDSFNCPSFFKTNSNIILPIESVYATIEIKSTLDYETLKQSVENIESVRKLKKLKNKNNIVITNEYTLVYPLGFVFAYSSKYTLQDIQKRLYDLNKNIDGDNQISMICILDKGLIFNVRKENMNDISLIPKNDTILAASDGNIENTLYSFYLLLMEYLNLVIISVPNLIEYASKMNAFRIKYLIPYDMIPNDAKFFNGKVSLDSDDINFIKNLRLKHPNLFKSNMSYDDMFKYLTTSFITLNERQLKSILNQNFSHTINIYGYVFTKESFDKFKKNVLNYEINMDSKKYVDNIVKEIYDYYKIEISNKN